jgi:ADP-heptose:LPS heptosyltransferase
MKLSKMLENEGKNLEEVIAKRNDAKELLISAKFADGHIHHVLPDKKVAKHLVEDIAPHVDLEFSSGGDASTKQPPSEVVFHNRQAIGDVLTFTSAVRDFKETFPNTRVGVISTAMHIWDNNPNIDHQFKDADKIVKIGPGFLTNKSNYWNHHMCNAFRLDIQNKLGIKFGQGAIRPDIWMTEEEYKRPPIIDGDYWVFIYGGEPGWPTKQYHRWQEVINCLRNDIKIVQLGVKSHPYPILNGVVNYVGKTENRDTGIRDLFNIFLHAQGSIGLVSMHMHLSAVFGNPSVVVAGGREPAWFTHYYGHQYVERNGTLNCVKHTACWACKLEGCKNLTDFEDRKIPKCVDIIQPEEIATAVKNYYDGGRLEYGKKIPNTFFKNITKEKRVFVAPTTKPIDEEVLNKYGFKWGGGSVTDRDWIFIKDIFKKYKVKTVMEFGCGLSTLLYSSVVDKVVSFETQPGWIKKISGMIPEDKDAKIYHWDGKNFLLPDDQPKRFDFAFVDGPAGGPNREWSTKAASELADLVIVHDAGRVPEREWQKKHLEGKYTMKSKGGHRCHFWVKNESTNPEIPKLEQREIAKIDVDTHKPLARVISTCRGYGGSERSTLYIMKMLREKGYRVDLISTGNICSPYDNDIPDGVRKTDWSTIQEPADVTLLYASDTIWGYHKPPWTDVMPTLNTKRKVMVLNFKIGGAGTVSWTKDWDKYMFLSSQHEGELLQRLPDVKTVVMPPPTDLTEYFKIEPNYEFPLRLIRHNSQRDAKHHPNTNTHIREVLRLDNSIQFHYMPAYSETFEHANIFKFKVNGLKVPQFLSRGNCFWYKLKDDYTEGGPKVVLEAMAAGLPCIVDNHSGPKDRVDDNTGWRCDTWEDYKRVIQEILENPLLLKIKGREARLKAKKEFIPERWIEEILA